MDYENKLSNPPDRVLDLKYSELKKEQSKDDVERVENIVGRLSEFNLYTEPEKVGGELVVLLSVQYERGQI